MKRITTLLLMVLLVGATIAFGAPTASATTDIEGPSLNIPVGTVVRGDVGSSHVLGTVSVSKELQGMVCDVHATATNQNSVHPGNDIVVSSNGASVTLQDVEREGFVTTTADGKLELGDSLTATLIMGKDKVFSGGIVVSTTCTPPPPDPVDVEWNTSLTCVPVDGKATYPLHAEQTRGQDVAEMSFDPRNGTDMGSGEPVLVTATWADPFYGIQTQEKTTNAAEDCTPLPSNVWWCVAPDTVTSGPESSAPSDRENYTTAGEALKNAPDDCKEPEPEPVWVCTAHDTVKEVAPDEVKEGEQDYDTKKEALENAPDDCPKDSTGADGSSIPLQAIGGLALLGAVTMALPRRREQKS